MIASRLNPWPADGVPSVGDTVRLEAGTLTCESIGPFGLSVMARYRSDGGDERVDRYTTHDHHERTDMDPNATAQLIIRAYNAEDYTVAERHAHDLLGWLNRGGFPPSGQTLIELLVTIDDVESETLSELWDALPTPPRKDLRDISGIVERGATLMRAAPAVVLSAGGVGVRYSLTYRTGWPGSDIGAWAVVADVQIREEDAHTVLAALIESGQEARLIRLTGTEVLPGRYGCYVRIQLGAESRLDRIELTMSLDAHRVDDAGITPVNEAVVALIERLTGTEVSDE